MKPKRRFDKIKRRFFDLYGRSIFVYISFLLSDWSALLAYLALSVSAVLKV